MISSQAFRHELRPLVLAEIGWMSMGIVDTVMVGHPAGQRPRHRLLEIIDKRWRAETVGEPRG